MNLTDDIFPLLWHLKAGDRTYKEHRGTSFQTVVTTCDLPLLLWLAANVGLPRKVTSLACDYAERVQRPEWKDNHPARHAIKMARLWARGLATGETCQAAAYVVHVCVLHYTGKEAHAAMAARWAVESADSYTNSRCAEMAIAAATSACDAGENPKAELAWQLAHARSIFTPELLIKAVNSCPGSAADSTPPFQGGGTGSIPVRGTTFS